MANKPQKSDASETRRGQGVQDAGRGDKLPENTEERADERLDEGVEETFPASDPVSVKITK